MNSINRIAKKLNIDKKNLYTYGNEFAKVDLTKEKLNKKNSKLILVTAMTPTKAGEGKTTTSIGLTDGLNLLFKEKKLNKVAVACLRQPSMGPLFGMKGGATGGGKASVIPEEKINVHFTGDIHALSSASLLISAIIDNSIYQGNPLNIDPNKIFFPRAVDVNDRALRVISVEGKNETHKENTVITAASELMTILCLSRDKEDFLQRIEKIIVAYDKEGKPIYLKSFNINNALWLILKYAFKPNLAQTIYSSPAIIHGGPFANIAHGCCSYQALKLGLGKADYVITEAGFGADLGGEKFMDILSRSCGLKPDLTVMVGSIRALKLQGGESYSNLDKENVELALKGLPNLLAHLDNMRKYGVDVICALNRFASDTEKEILAVKNALKEKGYEAVVIDSFSKGARGGIELAKKVIETLKSSSSSYHPLYQGNESIADAISLIAQNIYGAKDVEYSLKAKEDLLRIKALNPSPLYVCVAKTPLSFSDDAKILGRPKDFTLHVQGIEYSSGANLVVVKTGTIWLMPGLPKVPAAVKMEEEK